MKTRYTKLTPKCGHKHGKQPNGRYAKNRGIARWFVNMPTGRHNWIVSEA